MNKKTLSLVGMIVAVTIAFSGVLVMAGALGGDAGYASGASYTYDSGYATFGADFYNYVSNNAGEAASASRTTAGNLVKIADLLKNVCGIFLIGFGAMGFCYFGISFSEAKAAAVKAEEPVVISDPVWEDTSPDEAAEVAAAAVETEA